MKRTWSSLALMSGLATVVVAQNLLGGYGEYAEDSRVGRRGDLTLRVDLR